MKKSNEKQAKGLTLVELIITLGIIIIFITALFSAMISGLRYWNNGRMRLRAQEALRESLDTMNSELRQASPNPDPGINGNPPTGYKILPPVQLTGKPPVTGILYPNYTLGDTDADYILFTEPDEDYYNPGSQGWSEETPNNYQKIKYYTQSGILIREVTLYNSDGTVKETYQDNLVTLPDGELEMVAQYESETLVKIIMTASINRFEYTIETKVRVGS